MVAEPKQVRLKKETPSQASLANSYHNYPIKDLPDDSLGEVRRFLFDVETYHRLGEADIFHPDTRTELIEGEIIIMSPIGKRHAAKINRIVRLFTARLKNTAIVSVQNPMALPGSKSEFVPDVVLLEPREDFYEDELPNPENVLLLIEVCDTTLNYDRKKKLPLYARYGVRETWLVNLVDGVIEIYTEPKNAKYSICRIAQSGEKISPLAFPKLKIKVDDILK